MRKRILALLTAMLFMYIPTVEADFQSELAAFPADYHAGLTALHEQYPQWKFVPVNTGLAWNDVIAGESGRKSLVEKSFSTLLRNHSAGHYDAASGAYTFYDANTWMAASQAVIDYFVNPRNFLNPQYIFMFEALSYDASYHTQAGVELILNGTFMHNAVISYVTAAGEMITTDKTYAQVIMEAAAKSGVSPYYLASKIRTEIGVTPSGSVTGTYGNYHGIYNFYNIGANDSVDPISNGLNWASLGTGYGKPWTTPELSIVNGAVWLGELYISKGQNTMYFERFNVVSNSGYSLYTHQYMTNIYGVAGQAQSIYTGYNSAGTMQESKLFYIPVYRNMPAQYSDITFTGIQGQTGTAIGNGIHVRSGPSTLYNTVGNLYNGQAVTITGGRRTDDTSRMNYLRNPYWYAISYSGGSGYISAEYIALQPVLTLEAGQTCCLYLSSSAPGEVLYWENTNTPVASVTLDGFVTAKAPGTAVIRAFTSGGGMATVCVAVAGGFTDIAGHWAEGVIRNVCNQKLFSGTTDTTFEPNTQMSRAMFVTVLGRLYANAGGNAYGNASTLPYLDIDPTAWYAPYVAWAHNSGILQYDNSFFSPSAAVTRGEMMQMLYYFARYTAIGGVSAGDLSNVFYDYAALDPAQKEAVAWCYGNRIIRGYDDGGLAMYATATRAQVAQIIANMQALL